jgi:hypothetical protein
MLRVAPASVAPRRTRARNTQVYPERKARPNNKLAPPARPYLRTRKEKSPPQGFPVSVMQYVTAKGCLEAPWQAGALATIFYT